MSKKSFSNLKNPAASVAERMLTGGQKPVEQPSQTNTDKSAPIVAESAEQANTDTQTVPQPKQKRRPKKETHKTYTFWVDKEKLAEWRAYIATKGIKSEDLGLYAIQHWIDRVQPITAEEQAEYEEHLAEEQANINDDARYKAR